MTFDSVAYLIKNDALEVNEYGDSIATESRRMVFVSVKSIGMRRKIEAEQLGLKLECKFILSDSTEYDGEEIVECGGKRYNVVDVFSAADNKLELTVKRF